MKITENDLKELYEQMGKPKPFEELSGSQKMMLNSMYIIMHHNDIEKEKADNEQDFETA